MGSEGGQNPEPGISMYGWEFKESARRVLHRLQQLPEIALTVRLHERLSKAGVLQDF